MKKETLTKTSVVCLLATVCCFLWGSAFPSVKIGYQLFSIPSDDYAGQLLFAGLRFTLAGVLVVLFGSLLQKKPLLPNKTSITPIISLAMVQTFLQYLFFYMGLAHTTGVKSSIIVASNVFFSILLASLIFHYEQFTLPKCIGCLAGFTGIIIINLSGEHLDVNLSLSGEGAILLSALSSGLSSSLMKQPRTLKRIPVFHRRNPPHPLWPDYQSPSSYHNSARTPASPIHGTDLRRSLHPLGNSPKIQSRKPGCRLRIHEPHVRRTPLSPHPPRTQPGVQPERTDLPPPCLRRNLHCKPKNPRQLTKSNLNPL